VSRVPMDTVLSADRPAPVTGVSPPTVSASTSAPSKAPTTVSRLVVDPPPGTARSQPQRTVPVQERETESPTVGTLSGTSPTVPDSVVPASVSGHPPTETAEQHPISSDSGAVRVQRISTVDPKPTTPAPVQRLDSVTAAPPNAPASHRELPRPPTPRRLGLGLPIIPEHPIDATPPTAVRLSDESPPAPVQRAVDSVHDRSVADDSQDAPPAAADAVAVPTLGAGAGHSRIQVPAAGGEPGVPAQLLDAPARPGPIPSGEPATGSTVAASPAPPVVSRLVGSRAPLTASHSTRAPVDIVHSGPGQTSIDLRPTPSTVQRTERRDSYPAPNLTLSGAVPASSTPHAAQVWLPGASPVTVVAQRDVAQPEPSGSEPAAASPTEPEPTPDPAPATAPITTAPATAAAAAGGDPEELVKKLFDPLLRRLKAELWLDRERRGRLTDLRL
jgi:hypothetical protein